MSDDSSLVTSHVSARAESLTPRERSIAKSQRILHHIRTSARAQQAVDQRVAEIRCEQHRGSRSDARARAGYTRWRREHLAQRRRRVIPADNRPLPAMDGGLAIAFEAGMDAAQADTEAVSEEQQ